MPSATRRCAGTSGSPTRRLPRSRIPAECSLALLHSFEPALQPRGIDAPRAGAGRREIEGDEAVEDRRVAAVIDREKVLRRMRHPIGDRHRSGSEKCCGSGEQADRHEETTEQFDDPGVCARVGEGPAHARSLAWREGQELLRTMLEEQQPGNDAQYGVQLRLPAGKPGELHGLAPLMIVTAVYRAGATFAKCHACSFC